MNILLVHNYYQQAGGEDQVFADEGRLLESAGHRVRRFTLDNHQMPGGILGKIATARDTFWNARSYDAIAKATLEHTADVVHFHNTFPLVSPAAYYAARRHGAAVVQTLHNYRLLCPGGVLYRRGKACEKCARSALAWRGVAHGCYRQSRLGSAIVAGATGLHRALNTYNAAVDRYICLSQDGRRRFTAGGIPAEKLAVKPNFLDPDPGPGEGAGGYALFVARLSRGKGVETVIEAWLRHRPAIPLRIIGDGDLAPLVREASSQSPLIQWVGKQTPAVVHEAMGEAACVVFPSECIETFGRVIIEAFAKATPVIASRIGPARELIEHGRTGRLFSPGDSADLAAQVNGLMSDPAALGEVRLAAREEYLAKYRGAANLTLLIGIYRDAIAQAQSAAVNQFPVEATA